MYTEQRQMISVLLLMGPEGAGKSTVAEHLVAMHGFVELSFAGALRESALAMWNGIAAMSSEFPTLSLADTFDREKKEKPIGDFVLAGRPFSPRVLLQWFGTDILRNLVADDIWAHATLNRMRTEIAKGQRRFVFSDYRFSNERQSIIEFLRNQDLVWTAQTVRIVPGNISAEALVQMRAAVLSGHPSTHGWTTFHADKEIANPFLEKTRAAWLEDTCRGLVTDLEA
jgi:hypothetical protein